MTVLMIDFKNFVASVWAAIAGISEYRQHEFIGAAGHAPELPSRRRPPKPGYDYFPGRAIAAARSYCRRTILSSNRRTHSPSITGSAIFSAFMPVHLQEIRRRVEHACAGNTSGVLRRRPTDRDHAIVELRDTAIWPVPLMRHVFLKAEIVKLHWGSSAFVTASSVVKIAISRRLSS